MNYKKLFCIIFIATYASYLIYGLWGVSKLAVDTNEEVRRLSCRADCKLYKFGRKSLPKDCIGYCSKN